jgi:hypothetical protein
VSSTEEKQAIDCIHRMVLCNGWDYETAARKFYSEQPRVTARILDRIGSWPSSDPELAALQRVFR